jgi:hypothetical protein
MPTIPEIKSELKKLGIKGYSKLNKAELLELLSKHQNVKSNDNIKEIKKMKKQLLKMDIPKVKEIKYDFSKYDKKENNEDVFLNEMIELRKKRSDIFHTHETIKKISNHYSHMDINKFFDLFDKLNMSKHSLEILYGNSEQRWLEKIKLFFEYFKNHKLTFNQWLLLLSKKVNSRDYAIYTDLLEKYKNNKNINLDDELKKEFGNTFVPLIKQKLYEIPYNLKQKEIEVGTIKRKRKKDDAWRIQLAREWKNLNDMQESMPKDIKEYENYLDEYEKLKPSGGRRYKKITPSMYF